MIIIEGAGLVNDAALEGLRETCWKYRQIGCSEKVPA